MRYTATIKDNIIIAKGINHTDYVDEREIELTEEQYDSVPIPCKLIDGKFIPCEFPQSECVDIVVEPTAQDDVDAMLVDHEYRLTLLELGVNE